MKLFFKVWKVIKSQRDDIFIENLLDAFFKPQWGEIYRSAGAYSQCESN